MFKGIFGKKEKASDKYDVEKIKVTYKGGVISPEYEARTSNRSDVNDQDYSWHNLFPEGFGKIVYTYEGKVIEQYEGNFEAGQYHGKGKLIWEGEVYEGEFYENKFLEK